MPQPSRNHSGSRVRPELVRATNPTGCLTWDRTWDVRASHPECFLLRLHLTKAPHSPDEPSTQVLSPRHSASSVAGSPHKLAPTAAPLEPTETAASELPQSCWRRRAGLLSGPSFFFFAKANRPLIMHQERHNSAQGSKCQESVRLVKLCCHFGWSCIFADMMLL